MATTDDERRTWAQVHGRVFSGRRVPDDPFRESACTKVLLSGGLDLAEVDLAALRAGCDRVGDRVVCVADGEGGWLDELPLVVALTRERLEHARCETVFGHTNCHVFGTSGEWGLVAMHEGVALLGGSDVFMPTFLEAAGGAGAVLARFEENAHAIGYGGAGATFAQRLRRLVGWA